MKLYSLLSYRDALAEAGLLLQSEIINETLAIESITYHSKAAKPYTLFACKGAAFRKEYLDEAVDNGIACYLSEVRYDTNVPVSCLIVKDVRRAMALIADLFYDKAYRNLHLVGITGTKGKSTTAYYFKYIVDEYMQTLSQKPCGIVSSIDTYDGKIFEESHLTTPEAFELHRHFDNAIQSGLSYFVMEVSSQALKYDRVLGVDYEVGIFLNISEDHISPVEHSDFEDYFGAKLKLFSQTKHAVVNLDCDHSDTVLKHATASQDVLTFGTDPKADVYGYAIQKVGNEIHFRVRTADFDEPFVLTMPGLFNVENALAAISAAVLYRISLTAMQEGLRKARSSGRMEIYTSDKEEVIAIVDYAHNKLSFEKLYQSILEEYKGRTIITVFGCPGGKAYNRRVELGELAGRYSDKVYLTMEDPAFEDVNAISRDIAVHVEPFGKECYLIDDRGEAIRAAILDAPANSIVLITGKGNETRQKIGANYVPCRTDVAYAKEYLSQVKVND